MKNDRTAHAGQFSAQPQGKMVPLEAIGATVRAEREVDSRFVGSVKHGSCMVRLVVLWQHPKVLKFHRHN